MRELRVHLFKKITLKTTLTSHFLCVGTDPRSKAGNTSIDAGELRSSASGTEGTNTDLDIVMVERSARVLSALVASPDVEDTGTQHIIGQIRVTTSANSLVDCPDLDVSQLLRRRTTLL